MSDKANIKKINQSQHWGSALPQLKLRMWLSLATKLKMQSWYFLTLCMVLFLTQARWYLALIDNLIQVPINQEFIHLYIYTIDQKQT